MEMEGRAGQSLVTDGARELVRLTRSRALAVADAHGRWVEPVLRGNVFTAMVAAVAPGTALGTAPPLALWNPPGSGKILAPIWLDVGFVSGTLGAGHLCAAWAAQSAAPSGGSELVVTNNLLAATKGSGRAWSGSTVTTGIQLGSLVTLGTTPTTPNLQPCTLELAGRYLVQPGTYLAFQGIAATGTSPLVSLGLSWEELPFVS